MTGVQTCALPISSIVISQVVFYPRLGHSVKPPIIREHLISLFGDLPRIELFARNRPKGWDVFGNEVEDSVQLNIKTTDE